MNDAAAVGESNAPADAFRFSLTLLRRGPIDRSVELPEPAVVLGDLPEGLTGPLRADLHAVADGRGVRVTGEARAPRTAHCRRCLEEVTEEVIAEIDAWFLDDEADDESEASTWPLNTAAGEVDAGPAIREELWLASSDYLLCAADCPGLCPHCGAVRARESCECKVEEADSRWAALEALKSEDQAASDEAGAT